MSLPLPEQPSRNRSASAGDSGLPKHEHKRPRLSGSQDIHQQALHRSNSHANTSSATPVSNTNSTSTSHEPSASTSPPRSPFPEINQPDVTSPRSKVTINTRPISSQSSTMPTKADSAGDTTKTATTQSTDVPVPRTQKQDDFPDAISISSSEYDSPIIQVAVPEDLDQDPTSTRWEPISSTVRPTQMSIHPGYVRSTFPYAERPGRNQLSSVVATISKVFAEGASSDDEVFQKVQTWCVDFANNAAALTSEFFEDDLEFWQKFPSLVSGLLKRQVEPPSTLRLDSLVDFFVAYARIVKIVADADIEKLQSYPETVEPKAINIPLSTIYMEQLRVMISPDGVPLYDNLHDALDYSPTVVTEMIMDRLLESYAMEIITTLSSLFQAMVPLFTKRFTLLEQALNIVLHVGAIINSLADRASSLSSEPAGANDRSMAIMSTSSDFLQTMNLMLDKAINKQQPWLNIETCDKVFKVISQLVHILATRFPQLGVDLVLSAKINPSNFEDTEIIALASTAWRFTTLQKCIEKGRMEIRVACVQIMAQELVEVYNTHIRFSDGTANHPTVQFMIHLIRKNDIIRYIIGVDSHTQIIERSANIIGFLCVSRSYCNDDTDIIWQSIVESQDTRAVAALLIIFQTNFDNLSIDVLCDITRRLLALKFERVDGHMLEFMQRLLDVNNFKITREINDTEDRVRAHESAARLCIKILCECSVPEQACTDLSARIRSQVRPAFESKLRHMGGRFHTTLEPDPLHNNLVELCNNIHAHNHFASGSTLALQVILDYVAEEECSQIVQGHDVAVLLLGDVVHACNPPISLKPREAEWIHFEHRFGLLMTLIRRTNNAITGTLIENLWTSVLSNLEFDFRLRSTMWTGFANILDHSVTRNEALDIIIDRYLPTLSPLIYDLAMLHFVQSSVQYDVRFAPIDPMEPEEIVTIPGIERVWNIMLTAPPNTVELIASQFIIEQYLDGERVMRRAASSIEATHLSLIDRSVQQVITAASYLKSGPHLVMDDAGSSLPTDGIDPSSTSPHAIQFHRSLLFLRRFLDNLKTRPRYAPALSKNLKQTLDIFKRKGQSFDVTLQIIGHKSLASTQTKWTLGYGNSGVEVWQFLSDITGWSLFTAINGGRRMALKDEQRSLRDIGVRTGSFMVSKVQGSPETEPARTIRASSPVNDKVMHHFDVLYDLLELDNQYAKEVFDFLRMFSTQEQVLQRLRSMTLTPNQLLPVDVPFKLMYYARALRSCIEDESFSMEPDTDFLVYGTKTIIATLPNLNRLTTEFDIRASVAQGLLEALNLGLRARVPAEISASYIENASSFGADILTLWSDLMDISISESLIRAPFETLVESLLHNENLWSQLSVDNLRTCLERALLRHPLAGVRQAILEVIYVLTGARNSKLTNKNADTRGPRTRFPADVIETLLIRLWTVLLEIIQRANSATATCEEYFEAAISIFRQCQAKLDETDLQAYYSVWREILLTHQHIQKIGFPAQDFFTWSMGKMLVQLTRTMRQRKFVIHNNQDFIRQLLSSFLFPPLTEASTLGMDTGHAIVTRRDPILDMNARWILYELVLVLSHDRESLDLVCHLLDDNLIPQDIYFQPIISNDRQTLRSETGYSGLRNLSNTCYLNSLISQLFMNIEFRELVMSVNVIDHSKQKLVAELGRVFAYMQNSYEEAVSPESAIDAITLWDGDQIDVTVQMDVDEFFNLLFDRLESQIVDPKVCSAFKSIYGGQLVQQIKSRECEHVSERFEPFAAIQVEIKGKTTLEESLRAYVEGEVLQGENKYSCTGCGKHVDAVKRACLKVVPDHLIFNLKRFDFDITTGMRCKVNDEFGFPESINMAPYTLEALANSGGTIDPDIFELVGIIIHSGTAESGHYYSYIRQRPSVQSKDKSWVQFNDHDVTQFDPASIRECCFGGIDFGAIQCPKFYNGYMLFYQRSSSIQTFEQRYLKEGTSSALTIAPALESHIAQQNDLFLRSYVAQDAVHAKFIRNMLQQKRSNEALQCPSKHEDTSSRILVVALNYLNQISARWKDLPEVEETLTLLRDFAIKCETCAQVILDWLMRDEHLIDNLVRSCYAPVRKGFACLITSCWAKWVSALKVCESSDETDDDELVSLCRTYSISLNRFLAIMAQGWEHLQRHGRAWENYFGTLQMLLRLGDVEARAVIEANFLELTLELIHVHVPSVPALKRLRTKYHTYLSYRERNRPFAHTMLIQFFADLLEHVDLSIAPAEHHVRSQLDQRMGPSANEAFWLGVANVQPNGLSWLKKIIFGRFNPQAASSLVTYLCKTRQYDSITCDLLKEGLGDRNLVNATACLQPTINYLSDCTSQEFVIELAEEALILIESTNGQYGKEFLSFVQAVIMVINTDAPVPHSGFKQIVKKHIKNWAPALLMAPNDIHTDVRGETVDFLNQVLFADMDALQQTDPRRYRHDMNICKSLAKACAAYIESNFTSTRMQTVQAGQAHQVGTVVEHCLRFYGENASEEEEAIRIGAIMEDFKARVDSLVETTTEADWNASSDLEAMSEVDNMSDVSN